MKGISIPLFVLVFTFSATLLSKTKGIRKSSPVRWDYLLYVNDAASPDEKKQLESELLNRGDIQWQTESGSRMGFVSSLTSREIQSLSNQIEKVEAEQETQLFQVELKRNLKAKQWENLEFALKQNRIQILEASPPDRRPQSLKIKSPNLTIQKLFSLPQIGRYFQRVEEIN